MEAAMEGARVAESNYAKDPFDADLAIDLNTSSRESVNLTKWGKSLFQLSRFKDNEDSKKIRKDAISKLQEAIELDPFKHDTLWLLGKCFTISALKTPDPDEIKGYLHKALAYFKKASRGDPGNQVYIRSVQQVTKELEMNKNIHSIVEMDKDRLTIAFDELSIGAASSEAKAPETDKELHANKEVDKHIHSNAEMDNELYTNVEMDTDTHTNVEMDKGIHMNAETDRTSQTKVEIDDDIYTNVEIDKDIYTNTEMDMDVNAEMDNGIDTNAFNP